MEQTSFTEADGYSMPVTYANGLEVRLGNCDVTIILKLANKNIQAVVMSFPVAKAMLKAMQTIVDNLESVSGQTVISSDELGKLMRESHGELGEKASI